MSKPSITSRRQLPSVRTTAYVAYLGLLPASVANFYRLTHHSRQNTHSELPAVFWALAQDILQVSGRAKIVCILSELETMSLLSLVRSLALTVTSFERLLDGIRTKHCFVQPRMVSAPRIFRARSF